MLICMCYHLLMYDIGTTRFEEYHHEVHYSTISNVLASISMSISLHQQYSHKLGNIVVCAPFSQCKCIILMCGGKGLFVDVIKIQNLSLSLDGHNMMTLSRSWLQLTSSDRTTFLTADIDRSYVFNTSFVFFDYAYNCLLSMGAKTIPSSANETTYKYTIGLMQEMVANLRTLPLVLPEKEDKMGFSSSAGNECVLISAMGRYHAACDNILRSRESRNKSFFIIIAFVHDTLWDVDIHMITNIFMRDFEYVKRRVSQVMLVWFHLKGKIPTKEECDAKILEMGEIWYWNFNNNNEYYGITHHS